MGADVRLFNLGETSINDIAARRPGARALFRKYGLDDRCDGATSLAAVAARRGVDLSKLEARLAVLAPGPVEAPETLEGLIDHIVARYHQVHRRELPALIALAERFSQLHGGHPQAPKGLALFLERMSVDLGAHMQQEEEVLFPMLRAGDPMISVHVEAMRVEHEDHGGTLMALAELTHDFQPPPEASGTWRTLWEGLRKLADDLVDHIHAENDLLFPRFDP